MSDQVEGGCAYVVAEVNLIASNQVGHTPAAELAEMQWLAIACLQPSLLDEKQLLGTLD